LVDFQDHFWSFLHGFRLLYFYLGVWLRANGRQGEAGQVVDPWKAGLPKQFTDAWDLLAALRNEDVHTRPVNAEEGFLALEDGGHLLLESGERMVLEDYVVEWEGVAISVVPLCELCLSASERFVHEFPRHL